VRNTIALSVSIAALLLVGADAKAKTGSVSVAASASQMRALIYQEFGSGWLGRVMACIAYRESGLQPRQSNWHDSNGGSHGLFQINGINAPGGWATRSWIQRMYDPMTNIRMAHRLYRARGLAPWGGGC
jgi:hypothetical protein